MTDTNHVASFIHYSGNKVLKQQLMCSYLIKNVPTMYVKDDNSV